MSFVPTRYTSPPLLSELLKSLPDSAPSTNDLEILQDELKALQQRTLERARKAGNDIRLIEQSMRRIKEREKGKQKVTDRIKKERDRAFCLFLSYVIVDTTLLT
jgi:transcriptional adapter 3